MIHGSLIFDIILTPECHQRSSRVNPLENSAVRFFRLKIMLRLENLRPTVLPSAASTISPAPSVPVFSGNDEVFAPVQEVVTKSPTYSQEDGLDSRISAVSHHHFGGSCIFSW